MATKITIELVDADVQSLDAIANAEGVVKKTNGQPNRARMAADGLRRWMNEYGKAARWIKKHRKASK